MKQMLEKNPIDENSKNTDTLKWVGLMNNYKHLVEEIIFNELLTSFIKAEFVKLCLKFLS